MSRRIAVRYAQALGMVIGDDAALEPAADELRALAALLGDNAELRSALFNNAISLGRRRAVLNDVASAMGLARPVARLAAILLERGRLQDAALVADAFEDIVDERLNRVAARVTTAHELTPENEGELQRSLNAYTGKEVLLRKRVNPKIIGGVRVDMRGKVIDGTLRTRLRRLREYLLAEETA